MTEKDVEPQYDCKICKDTGYLENGERCRCFPLGGAPPDEGGKVGAGKQNT